MCAVAGLVYGKGFGALKSDRWRQLMQSGNGVCGIVDGADKGQREMNAEAIDQFSNEVDDGWSGQKSSGR